MYNNFGKRSMKSFIALIVCLLAFSICPVKGQNVALKTNVLYDATATVNAGVEFSIAPKWTMDISGNYNGWSFSDNRKWKHWLVQPEIPLVVLQQVHSQFSRLSSSRRPVQCRKSSDRLQGIRQGFLLIEKLQVPGLDGRGRNRLWLRLGPVKAFQP